MFWSNTPAGKPTPKRKRSPSEMIDDVGKAIAELRDDAEAAKGRANNYRASAEQSLNMAKAAEDSASVSLDLASRLDKAIA